MAIEWTNGRVTAAVMAGCLVSGFMGAEWQRLADSDAVPVAQAEAYDSGMKEGVRRGDEAKVQAFEDGMDEGRAAARSDMNDAYDDGYDNGYDDGQSDSLTPYQDSAPDPAPFYNPDDAYGSADQYPNCSAAEVAGAAPVRRGQPGYGRHLDRDGDGVGCE